MYKIKPCFYKKFADWQRTPEGKEALEGQNFPDAPGRPFNNLTANPFLLTRDKTDKQVLDYEKNLCYR